MSVIESALGKALEDAAQSNEALKSRAWHCVTALQKHVAADGGRKVLKASNDIAPMIATWAAKHELTPGEAALCLSSYIAGLLVMLPGCSIELARAIAIELAGGPRSE